MLLTEANGHGDTEDANILAARKRFDELYAQCKPQIDAEAEQVRAAGGLFIIGTERMRAAASTTSCAAVPAVRATRVLPAST